MPHKSRLTKTTIAKEQAVIQIFNKRLKTELKGDINYKPKNKEVERKMTENKIRKRKAVG